MMLFCGLLNSKEKTGGFIFVKIALFQQMVFYLICFSSVLLLIYWVT